MLEVTTKQEFIDLLKANKLVIVDFFADWCGPCKKIAPYFIDLSEIYKSIKFVKVNVDELEEVAGFLDVSSLPTFILFKNGVEVSRTLGASNSGLENLVRKGMES